ncbi:MAG: RagB/SusD family nutrient uptake outer membrane protein [Bacteroidales bacterium]|nr:RagB/SusD family nutrient uptake outer membrane protein [Bacteroidales bacterium]
MKKILILLTIILSGLACNDDLLDMTPKDRLAEDAVWNDEKLIKAYHTALYNAIPHGFKIHMQSKATDEAYCAINWGIGIIQSGTFSPDNITGVADTDWTGGGYLYYWNTAYKYLAKINLFLQKMEETSLDFPDKTKLIAEAKFIRAYLYFLLIERFGGVPIVTEAYQLEDVNTVTFTRSTFDQCVAFIEQDLDEAIPDLPVKLSTTESTFGRATQDACKALLSRVLLFAASPLFNPSNDIGKWQKASDAAEDLLNSGYSLYPNYGKCFNLASGAENNEVIFARNFTETNSHQAPMHNLNRRYGAYGGWWASNGPSQNLVDDYDMINGEPAFIYPSGVKTVNPASGYDPQRPYANRDPRFDASIIHDSSIYRGSLFEMWIASDAETWGYDSYKQSGDNPRTNYVLRKFMPDEDMPVSWQTFYTIPWIYFRLAEIYLNYAEAQFELGHEDVCREYLRLVRNRVGMPPIPETVTGEELRARLYNERRIELAFEDHRFWDVRRWKIAMDVENRPIMGMDIIRDVNTGTYTYSPVQMRTRLFEEKMYLLPIATDELNKLGGTVSQTTGW